MEKLLIAALLVFLPGVIVGQREFSNPISDMIAPDPQILRLGEFYYMVLSIGERNMVVFKSRILTDFRGAPSNTIYEPDSSYDACWAPELHQIDGEIYVYFSMHKSGEVDHRMWVSRAQNSSDPMGPWDPPVQLMADEAEDANDGTVFKHPTNGQMYYVFTRRRIGVHDPALHIAPMSDPYTVEHPRVLLRYPDPNGWDCCINEGAFVIVSPNNISHLIFSGSGAGAPGYALGRMSILPELDPLDAANWGPAKGPVLSTNEDERIYGPGHAAFVTSPDESELWMVYHAQNTSEANYLHRMAYLDKMEWDMIGYPIFPVPHGEGHPQTVPSGQDE